MAKPWERDWAATTHDGPPAAGEAAPPWKRDWAAAAPPVDTGASRTIGQHVTDIGASALLGLTGVSKVPAMLLDKGITGQWVGPGVEAISEFENSINDQKSPHLRAKEQAMQQRTAAAGKEAEKWAGGGDGFGATAARILTEFGVGAYEAVKDPALLTAQLAQQGPMLGASRLGGLATDAAARGVAAAAPALAASRIGQAAVGAAGTAGAIGAGAALQGADIGTDAYQRLMALPASQWARVEGFNDLAAEIGVEAAKSRMASSKAMTAAVQAGLASVLSTALPGGASVERALVGKGLGGASVPKAIGKAFVGEATQEGVEEGYGALAANAAVQQVDPTTRLSENVGGAAGQGAVLGGLMGGGVGGAHAVKQLREGAADKPVAPPAAAGAPQGAINADEVLGADPQNPAEVALHKPRPLTALDRVAEIDRELQTNPDDPALVAERLDLSKDWPKTLPGNPTTISTEAGATVEGRYALIEATDAQPSHDVDLRPNAAYPAELQPRDRTRAASEAQIASIVGRLDPARLGLSQTAADGAPIIGEDGLVESGNARTIALQRVYRANGLKADAYRSWLRDNAAQFGLDPADVEGMQQPVLVRVRETPVDRAEFARQSNASTVAAMSPLEQARSDAARIDSMDDLQPDEGGDFATSRDFIRRFVGRLPATERAGMIDAAGRLSSSGYARVRNAVLAKAYGESPVLGRMVESNDDNLRNVSKALMLAAPRVAKARSAIDAGHLHDADITPHLVSAVEALGQIKDSGGSVADALSQADLTGEKFTPETRELVQFLADNARSPRRMAEFVTAYFDALEAMGNPNQGSLLGETAAPTTGELLTGVSRATKGVANADAENAGRGYVGEAAPGSGSVPGQPADAPRSGGSNQDAQAAAPVAANDSTGEWQNPRDLALADIKDAIGELGDFLTQHMRAAFTEEDKRRLMPILVKIYDGVIRAVGYEVKRVMAAAREKLRANKDVLPGWNKIPATWHREAIDKAVASLQERGQQTGLFSEAEFAQADLFSAPEPAAPKQAAPAVAMIDGRPYDFDRDNFKPPRVAEFLSQDEIAHADGLVSRYYTNRQPPAISAEDRARAEALLAPLIEQAKADKVVYDQKIIDIAKRTGALGQMLAPVKGMKRAAEKLAAEEKFNLDGMKDMLRSTIVVSSYADAQAVLSEIESEFALLRPPKNRTNDYPMVSRGQALPAGNQRLADGYTDLMVNVVLPSGLIAEIQVNVPEVLGAKDAQGHKLYEAYREAPKESPLGQEIRVSMLRFYDTAFEAAKSRDAAAYRKKASSVDGSNDSRRGKPLGTSDAPSSDNPNTRPSGKTTRSSPPNESKNSQPGGNLSGTLIASTAPIVPEPGENPYTTGKGKSSNVATDANDREGDAGSRPGAAPTVEGAGQADVVPAGDGGRGQQPGGERVGAEVELDQVPEYDDETSAAGAALGSIGPAAGYGTRLSRGAVGGIAMPALQAVASRVAARLKGLPTVHVLASPVDAPAALRSFIEGRGALADVEGALHDGAIYLFASGIEDETRAEHVLAEHEAAHAGLAAMLGAGRAQAMQAIYNQNAEIRRAAKPMIDAGMALAEAVEEVIVEIPSAQLARLKGWRLLVGKVRDALARMGFERLAAQIDDWLAGNLTEQQRADLAVADLVRAARGFVAKQRTATIADDAAAQGAWLAKEAKARGFSSVDDLAARNMALFEKLAETWRGKHPAAAMLARGTSRAANAPGWVMPGGTRFDSFVYKMQDKMVDLKRAVSVINKSAGQIQDRWDAYLQEELFHERAAKRTQDFVFQELDPLLTDMKARGVTQEALDAYLHARHAKEANRVIADRNPKIQDGGSGMTDAEADAYMAALTPSRKADLNALAKRVDAIIAKTRDTYVGYGLESKDTVDGWAKMFKHYVPLMREDHDGGMGIGQGFSVRGDEAKHRTGSTAKVVDILANIALQREKAIVRGEKNRVAVALAGLASTNPNPDVWTFGVVPKEQVFNPQTGKVEERKDPLFKSRPNALVAKILDSKTGKVHERAVIFNERNERAMRLASALKNLDAAALEGVIGLSAKITRYFAAINTQYNPVFGAVNLVRDVQGALINLQSTPLAEHRKAIMGYTASALKGVYVDSRAARAGKPATSPWSALWEEFQLEGGATGFRDLYRTSADRAKKIERAMDPTKWMQSPLGQVFTAGGTLQVPMAIAQEKAGWLFDWLSDYNQSMENAVRLSAYKVGIEQGMTKQRAASLAKNLTVNFNRRGQAGMQAGALYAFFNAGVQGTARMAEVLFDMREGDPRTLRLSKVGKRIVAGGILLGAMNALMLAAAGFDDEEPPEFVRERNLVIPIGGKKYIAIPMPLGWHVLPNLGRVATEFMLGGFKDPAKHVIGLMGVFADAFNPIGNAGLSMQTLAPTPLDPLVALTENRDWTGRPIAAPSFNDATPGFSRAKDTATMPARWIAEAINWMSGGTHYKAGAWSPTPDQIDYLWGQVTGGVGREAAKAEQTVRALVSGEELPPHKVPLVGRFYGDAEGSSGQAGQFYTNLGVMDGHEAQIKGLAKAAAQAGSVAESNQLYAERESYMKDNPEAELWPRANLAQRRVRQLRDRKRDLVKADAPRAEVKAVEDDITKEMREFNAEVRAAREPTPAHPPAPTRQPAPRVTIAPPA